MKLAAKISFIFCCLVLCFSLVESVNAQLSFQKTYNLKTETASISQADGNGGVVTAGTYLGEHGNSDLKISLTRFDKNGKFLWSKYYRNPGKNLRLISFITVDNGDYMLAGFVITKDDQSRYEIFLIRVNNNGDIVWSRNYSNEYRTVFYSLGRTGDNGFFLYANHNDAPAGLGYNIIIKVDQNGNIKWTKRYSSTYKWGTATATRDGGFVISNVSSVYKINNDGNVIWAKEFTEIGSRDIGKISELSDDGILLNVWPTANKNGFLFKLDKNGNLLWTSGNKNYNYFNFDPIPKSSGSFLLTANGRINAFPTQNHEFIVQMDAGGKILNVLYPKTNINVPQLISSGENLFIGGTKNALLVIGKVALLEAGSCFDTSSVLSSPSPEISSSDISVPQNEISFLEKDLPLGTDNLELQEDTLCFDCKKHEFNLGNDRTVCAGEILTLNAGVEDLTYEWSTGEKTSSITVNKAGIYWLKITNECGSVTDTIIVNYNKAPEFKIKVSPQVAKPWEQLYFSDSTSDIKNRYWDFGDGSFSNSAKAEHTYGKNGNFTVKLQLEDSFGCKYSFTEKIKVRFESLYLPNAFSPDGNGLNDSFGVVGYGIDYYKLKIYNRWGELIFDKENQSWDGKFNGTGCPAGLYLYMLEAIFENKTVNRYGYFYLEK